MAPSSEPPADFLTVDAHRQRIWLNVHLQPGAKSNALAGVYGDALKIRINAPAVDNQANAALIAYLGKLMGIPANHICIRGGRRSRRKRIEIIGAGDAVVAQLRAAFASMPENAPH